MSDDRDRGGDGLLIGILVVLALLVVGGVGLGLVSFRMLRVERERAIMELEQARRAEEQARIQVEQARALAEQARARAVSSAQDAEPDSVVTKTGETRPEATERVPDERRPE